MDFSQLSPADKERMSALIEQKQMKDFLHMFTTVVDKCFNDCVHDFTSKTLGTKESTCLNRCVGKFMKHTERVGARFAEQNALMTGPPPGPS